MLPWDSRETVNKGASYLELLGAVSMFMRTFERRKQVGGGEDSELSYLVSPFLNINETSGFHCLHLQIILHDLESPPNLLAPFRKDSTPLA